MVNLNKDARLDAMAVSVLATLSCACAVAAVLGAVLPSRIPLPIAAGIALAAFVFAGTWRHRRVFTVTGLVLLAVTVLAGVIRVATRGAASAQIAAWIVGPSVATALFACAVRNWLRPE